MGFEAPRPPRPLKPTAPNRDDAPLPRDIAFLLAGHVDEMTLQLAARRARDDDVPAARALVAHDGVSETLYCLALARRLGLPFVGGWTWIPSCADPARALRRGRAKLASGAAAAWLVAPTDADIGCLLRGHAMGLPLPDIAITTPGHFSQLLRQGNRQAFAEAASLALPTRAPRLSAKGATDRDAGLILASAVLLTALGLWFAPFVVTTLFGVLFFASMVFRLLVCAAGLAPDEPPGALLANAHLPDYSILVPLHHEAGMVEGLVAALKALDYPRSKLEVFFLTEADDGPTRMALRACALPAGFKVVTVPEGSPRTKPRALNLGLMLARGRLLTVFDAEDRPEPDQLRKAATIFDAVPPTVACLQARLAVWNSEHGLLASLCAIDYAALFDLYNVGLSRWNLPIALGGTSNHFRADVLRAVGGWDAWNVTEDADLGLRLARLGYETRTFASTTWETALVDGSKWLKQRRRWTKGWMQTLAVLARDHAAVVAMGPTRTFALVLMLTNLVTGPLLLPFVLFLVGWQVVRDGFPNPDGPIETLGATLAVSVALLGVASIAWCGYAGLRRRALERFWWHLPLLLPYQVLISVATWFGLWDLAKNPYHWHKTDHGRPSNAALHEPAGRPFFPATVIGGSSGSSSAA